MCANCIGKRMPVQRSYVKNLKHYECMQLHMHKDDQSVNIILESGECVEVVRFAGGGQFLLL